MRKGANTVSVRVFPLLKPYRPALFPAAAKELDRVAAQLAAKAGSHVTASTTTRVDGHRIRAYRFGSNRIGFVLVGKREYQLLCELPSDPKDGEGACGLLFSSFSEA